jgi:N-acetyl-anhydromuramyl-L-alanine amidase AmpD
MDIKQYQLPTSAYNQEEHPKTQIFIHHTAGNSNPYSAIDWWKSQNNKIATAFVIAGKPTTNKSKYADGDIIQAFPSKCWAYHLGLQSATYNKFSVPYISLDKISIGIELNNWGGLTKDAKGNYVTYVRTIVPEQEVIKLDKPYRGFEFYHKYTDAQLSSLKELLTAMCNKYGIPKTFNANMFEVNKDALSGKPGIWTHTSVRYDKTDCSPQHNLIEMLKTI